MAHEKTLPMPPWNELEGKNYEELVAMGREWRIRAAAKAAEHQAKVAAQFDPKTEQVAKETAEEEIAEEEIAEEETAGEETAGEETAGEETAGEETAGEETVEMETAEMEAAEMEMPEKKTIKQAAAEKEEKKRHVSFLHAQIGRSMSSRDAGYYKEATQVLYLVIKHNMDFRAVAKEIGGLGTSGADKMRKRYKRAVQRAEVDLEAARKSEE